MTVALLSKGVDAFPGWDPRPIVALKDVPGAVEVFRGGDVIAALGHNVGMRAWGGTERGNGREIFRRALGSRPVDT